MRDSRGPDELRSINITSNYLEFADGSAFFEMGRNKIIYALSDWSLVVDATPNKGGTWAGATENLKHQWVPLFIRNGLDAPAGNSKLLSLGGIAFGQEQTTLANLKEWLDSQRDHWELQQEPKSKQLSLFT